MSDVSVTSQSASSQSFALNYRIYESKKQCEGSPILVIHGMSGSIAHWDAFCKSYSELTKRQIIAIDLRNHGHSPRSDHMTYPLMADDIEETMKQLNIPKAILIGHSIGGRVAMEAALRMPSCIEKVIVEDITPFAEAGPMVHVVVSAMLNADLTQAKDVTDVDDMLAKSVEIKRIRDYVLESLQQDEDGKFHWLTNIKSLQDNVETLLGGIELDERRPYPGDIIFIGGEQSDSVNNADMDEIRKKFPKAERKMIPDVGHFVHANKHQEFIEIVHNFLS